MEIKDGNIVMLKNFLQVHDLFTEKQGVVNKNDGQCYKMKMK